MCRICGRMVKCIFDSMPSRVPTASSKRTFTTITQSSRSQKRPQHISSGSLVRSAFNLESKATSCTPPSFLLPFRAKLHQAATQQAATSTPQFHNTPSEIPPSMSITFEDSSILAQAESSTEISNPSSQSKPLVLSKSLQQLLPALEAQKPHYITAHVHRFPYLITTGDTLRLPFHMHGVEPGDILRLNRASIIGSRDYTLKAGMNNTESYDKKRTGEPNYLDERLFECRVRVLGVDSQPMTMKEKTKRRNRKVKTVRSKHKYTVMKVVDVKVKTLDELKAGEDSLLLE